MPLRRQPVDASAGRVTHAVAADTGIVPIGDEQAAIGRHANVAGPEPIVRARHHIFAFHGVAGPVRRQADPPGRPVPEQREDREEREEVDAAPLHGARAAQEEAGGQPPPARAEAEALKTIAEALGVSGQPAQYLIAKSYLESLNLIAANAQKVVFLPIEAAATMGAIGGIKELLKETAAGSAR